MRGKTVVLLSYCIFWLLVLAAVVAVVFSGSGVRDDPVGTMFSYTEEFEHGWPVPFLRREVRHTSCLGPPTEPSGRNAFWNGDCDFELFPFVVDCGFLACILGLAFWRVTAAFRARSLFTFSLCLFLMIVAAISASLAHVSFCYRQCAKERRVEKWLRDNGHGVGSAYRGPTWLLRLWDGSRHWNSLRGVADVNVHSLSDEKSATVAMHLGELSRLRCIWLAGARITDENAQKILRTCAASHIDTLDLSDTTISHSTLELVASHVCPRRLYVSRTNIGDADIQALSGCSSVRVLSLTGTRISLDSVAVLRSMPRLRTVYLNNTQFDDASPEVIDSIGDAKVVCGSLPKY